MSISCSVFSGDTVFVECIFIRVWSQIHFSSLTTSPSFLGNPFVHYTDNIPKIAKSIQAAQPCSMLNYALCSSPVINWNATNPPPYGTDSRESGSDLEDFTSQPVKASLFNEIL